MGTDSREERNRGAARVSMVLEALPASGCPLCCAACVLFREVYSKTMHAALGAGTESFV